MPHQSTSERVGHRQGRKDEARVSILEILESYVKPETPDLAARLARIRTQFEEDPPMPDHNVLMPITKSERFGRTEGRQDEARTTICQILKIRDGVMSSGLASRLKQINDIDRLRQLRKLLISGTQIDELLQILNTTEQVDDWYEGLLEERVNEAQASILDLMEARLGTAPPDLVARVKQITDLDRLHSVRRLLSRKMPLTDFEQAFAKI